MFSFPSTLTVIIRLRWNGRILACPNSLMNEGHSCWSDLNTIMLPSCWEVKWRTKDRDEIQWLQSRATSFPSLSSLVVFSWMGNIFTVPTVTFLLTSRIKIKSIWKVSSIILRNTVLVHKNYKYQEKMKKTKTIFFTEIKSSHYARDLLTKMLERRP
jgi:hypothetical protein